jgi:flagellar motility protein MotE (MotC chaperone)
MALRDQPYIPFYVQDFMTDEKLRECEPETIGVYVFMMCLFHKSTEYGKILLNQKDKQTDNQIHNFAFKVGKHIPWRDSVIILALEELLEYEVVEIKGDSIVQKRMVSDNILSIKRSKAGKKGGKVSKELAQANNRPKEGAKAKANSESEYEVDNDIKKPIILNIPSIEDFLDYAKSKVTLSNYDMLENQIKLKYESWIENNWHTGGQTPRQIKNWKTTLLNTISHMKPESSAAKKTASGNWRDKIQGS